MKYIEELKSGDIFVFENKNYFLTSDFKKNGYRLSYSISDGFAKWLDPSTMVEAIQIYTLDENNNIIPIKETLKENEASIKNSNIPQGAILAHI